jgi:hypothetical protein
MLGAVPVAIAFSAARLAFERLENVVFLGVSLS